MKILFLSFFFLVSCATRTPVTDKLTRKLPDDPHHNISQVPVIAQKKNHCGPASLGMVLKFYGNNKSPDDLAHNLFHQDLGGSFRSDILASARREGMMVFEIDDLRDVLKEVKDNHPVIIFQNLGLESAPQWHFSVLRGYDLATPQVYMNAGEAQMTKMDMHLFERSWILGGKWGALILPPHKLSKTISGIQHVEAASLLEASGNHQAALVAYESILQKWPQESLAMIGAANASYALKKVSLAEKFLLRAVKENPQSAIAFHNLAFIQNELGKVSLARKNATQAMSLATSEQRPQFQVTLEKLYSQ